MKSYILVGYTLLIAFFAQELLDLRWDYLMNFQLEENYKRWSGLGLFLIIGFQWILTIVRASSKGMIPSLLTNCHKWLGALSPLIFYIHSMKLGFAYLFFLSVTFFSNTLIGYTNLEMIKNQPRYIYQGWMIMHVGLSLIISVLTVFHIWIVFLYE